MLTLKEISKLKSIVSRLIEAEINDTWKGSGYPEDIDEIERELEVSREIFDAFLNTLYDGNII